MPFQQGMIMLPQQQQQGVLSCGSFLQRPQALAVQHMYNQHQGPNQQPAQQPEALLALQMVHQEQQQQLPGAEERQQSQPELQPEFQQPVVQMEQLQQDTEVEEAMQESRGLPLPPQPSRRVTRQQAQLQLKQQQAAGTLAAAATAEQLPPDKLERLRAKALAGATQLAWEAQEERAFRASAARGAVDDLVHSPRGKGKQQGPRRHSSHL
jgi:hypothetical protein